MSKLFGGGAPAPQPVPVNPMYDTAAQEKRRQAEVSAIADAKARGRGTTDVAGGDLAAQDQYERGLLKKSRRSAVSAEVLG